MENSKETNPKEVVGETKVPLALLSPIAQAYWAAAQFCGLTKYGAWNWREAGVCASTYISALGRHLAAYSSGEEYDSRDGTHHLGNAMACCAILLEARAIGKLVDDRGPDISDAMRAAFMEVEENMKQIKARYADKNPRHYTIADSVPKTFNVEQQEEGPVYKSPPPRIISRLCRTGTCRTYTRNESGYRIACAHEKLVAPKVFKVERVKLTEAQCEGLTTSVESLPAPKLVESHECGRCNGWGSTAYFEEQVDCKDCRGTGWVGDKSDAARRRRETD